MRRTIELERNRDTHEVILDPPGSWISRAASLSLLLVVIAAIGIPLWYVYGAPPDPAPRSLFGEISLLDIGTICGGFSMPSRLEGLQNLVQMFWSQLCGG